jgi:cytochrome bd-type quinol oxidase subunit 2
MKTKIPIKKTRLVLRVVSLSLSLLAFLVVFFELTVIVHGGWADVSHSAVFIAPLFASVGMLAAVINIVKYRSKGKELVPALAMVVMSALFFCYVMLYTSYKLAA